MKYYGGTVTVAGRDLITSLLAGETIEFTRIVVGSGEMPEGVEPIDMTDLVAPVAEATSTVPTVENGVLSMVVEYRNDLNGGIKTGFWLHEFGIYAKTENRKEILLYYATLGDSPQPVNAYIDNRIDIRRYPVTIAMEIEADVQVTYNPGSFITASEAQGLIGSMVKTAFSPVSSIIIPAPGWTLIDGEVADEYIYVIDVECADSSEDLMPSVTVSKDSLGIANAVGMCPTAETFDGIIRFWAKDKPAADIEATVAFMPSSNNVQVPDSSSYKLPVATSTVLGGIKGSDTIVIDEDGTAHAVGTLTDENTATDEEVSDMIEDVFDDESGTGSESGTGTGTDIDIATDKEVSDMIDEVFGADTGTGNEVATDEEVAQMLNDIFGVMP